ncbi:DUF397 domain-containing protein [Streptomyces sp. JNUCC 64]
MNTRKLTATLEGAIWRKSSHSGSEYGQCLEITERGNAVHVRDSKNPDSIALTFTTAQFTTFARFASEPGA